MKKIIIGDIFLAHVNVMFGDVFLAHVNVMFSFHPHQMIFLTLLTLKILKLSFLLSKINQSIITLNEKIDLVCI